MRKKQASLIKHLCYELYKAHWIRTHVPEKLLLKTIRNYYEGLIEQRQEDSNKYTYESYLDNVSFSGEKFVSFDEFLEHEYQAKGYIWLLLDGANHLFQMYLKDIGAENKQNFHGHKDE